MLFFLGCVLPYLAVAVFTVGTTWRTWRWLKTPVPFRLTLSPPPHGVRRRAATMARELLLFESLYRGDRDLWRWAWLMHLSLASIIIGHALGIAFTARQFTYLGFSPAASTTLSRTLGVVCGAAFVAAVLVLWYRRTTVAEVRRLSDPADYFDLALLLAIAVTGLGMRLGTTEMDLTAVRTYLGGLLTLRPVPIPGEWIFVSHVTLVNVLLVYFPFSKLIHLTGGIVSRALLVQAPRAHSPVAGR